MGIEVKGIEEEKYFDQWDWNNGSLDVGGRRQGGRKGVMRQGMRRSAADVLSLIRLSLESFKLPSNDPCDDQKVSY